MFKNSLIALAITSFLNLSAQCDPKSAGPNIGDQGCVNFTYQNNSVFYKTVRTADGNEWLLQNLGSKKVAESISDKDAYGDYFQYGRWDDGHQLATSTTSEDYPSPNNPIGLQGGNTLFYINGGTPWSQNYNGWWANPLQNDTWTAKDASEVTANNGIDPCKAIGENWEMPSEQDWDLVMQKEQIFPKPAGATNNGIIRAFESLLKIPGAGARKDDGWAFVDQRAYLWTKTASSNPNFYRYVYLGSATSSTNGFGGDAKSFGYPIRCFKKEQILGVQSSEKNINFTIAPNPAENYIKMMSIQKVKTVEIYSINGQKIISSEENTVDVSKLKKGLYLVKVIFEDGKYSTEKFIKK